MTKQYNIDTTIYGETVIWYEENGVRISFMQDETNPDYQRYLRWLEDPNADEATPLA